MSQHDDDLINENNLFINDKDISDVLTEVEIENEENKNNIEYIKRKSLLLIKQDVNRVDNEHNGWSNPELSDKKTLDQEVINFQYYYNQLKEESNKNNKDDKKIKEISDKINYIYMKIAGYYSNYENRWLNKLFNLFENTDDFYDFYYTLLFDCMIAFKANKYVKNDHKTNFKKNEEQKSHFNQYFWSSLSKRKISLIKKKNTLKRNPSVKCEICGNKLTKIDDYHLKHLYNDNKLKKDFNLKIDKNKIYDECPVCKKENVTLDHIKSHSYAESITVNEYIERFPNSNLTNEPLSLQQIIYKDSDGDGLTIEEVCCNQEHFNNESKEKELEEHIDYVFDNDNFTRDILKLKMKSMKNKDISESLGEIFEFIVDEDKYKELKKDKNKIYKYLENKEYDFIKRNKTFEVLDIKSNGIYYKYRLSSLTSSKINFVIKKLKKDKFKLQELFQ